MFKHQIVIFDGADRVGKSSCIDKLIYEYEEKNYTVITMFHPENISKNSRDIAFKDDQKFESHYKTNSDMYSISSGNLDLMSYWMKKMFDININQNTVILIDRLHLSSLVFGMTLRRSSFKKLFKTSDNFVEFMNTFERRIQVFSDVTLFTLINDSEITKDDNEHEIVKMSVDKLQTTNSMFEIAHSLSVIKNKYLLSCVANDDGWFNTWDQIINILSKNM